MQTCFGQTGAPLWIGSPTHDPKEGSRAGHPATHDSSHFTLYKYTQFVKQWDNGEFDKLYEPGSSGGWSGIYRCHGCGREVVHTMGKPLPPQNHHQHTLSQGKIQWRIVVTDSPDPT